MGSCSQDCFSAHDLVVDVHLCGITKKTTTVEIYISTSWTGRLTVLLTFFYKL
jgi:hypothetical protein